MISSKSNTEKASLVSVSLPLSSRSGSSNNKSTKIDGNKFKSYGSALMTTTESSRTTRSIMASSTTATSPNTSSPPWSTDICDLFSSGSSRSNRNNAAHLHSSSRTDCCSLTFCGILQYDFHRHLLLSPLSSSSKQLPTNNQAPIPASSSSSSSSWWSRILIWILVPFTALLAILILLEQYLVLNFVAMDSTEANDGTAMGGAQGVGTELDSTSTSATTDPTTISIEDDGTSTAEGTTGTTTLDASQVQLLVQAMHLVLWTFIPTYLIVLALYSSYYRRQTRRLLLERLYQERYLGTDGEDDDNDGYGITSTSILPLDSYVQLQERDTQRAHSWFGVGFASRSRRKASAPGSSPVVSRQSLGTFGGGGSKKSLTRHSSPDAAADGGSDGGPVGDLCTSLWNILRCCCCCCCCYVQCCGMCATSQEARELQRLLPKYAFQRDYITFQPWMEYIGKIQDLRTQLNGRWVAHARALSKLSQRMLVWLGTALLWLTAVALLGLDPNFAPQNLLVLFGTLLQKMAIMYLVHWQWHKFDLSLDAVIKYFSSGFLLCTVLAMTYEVILGFLVNIISYVVITIGIIWESPSSIHWEDITSEQMEQLAHDFTQSHPGIVSIFVGLNAFVIAAGVEEMSKYFGFWMVEHVDLMDPSEIDMVVPTNNTSVSASPSSTPNSGLTATSAAVSNTAALLSVPVLYPRTRVSRGTATTIAMVAVAAGFACSENLLYIFVYTPPTVKNELATLIARSMFPVHELCAALQSLGVIQRDLEGNRRVGLGRILFPAFLLHGTFDFVLMLLSALNPPDTTSSSLDDDKVVIVSTDDAVAHDSNINKNDDGTLVDVQQEDILPMALSIALVLAGILYYICEARRQRIRLQAIDNEQVTQLLSLTTPSPVEAAGRSEQPTPPEPENNDDAPSSDSKLSHVA